MAVFQCFASVFVSQFFLKTNKQCCAKILIDIDDQLRQSSPPVDDLSMEDLGSGMMVLWRWGGAGAGAIFEWEGGATVRGKDVGERKRGGGGRTDRPKGRGYWYVVVC